MNDFLNLRLAPKELDYIFNVVARQPWMEVHELIMNVQQQVKEQNDARNRPNGPTEPDPTSGPG